MTHLWPFLLCLAGFTALALATDRQGKAVLGRPLPVSARGGLRIAGACALLLALATLVAWRGWGLGLVMFSGHTSLAAGLVHCALIAHARVGGGGRGRSVPAPDAVRPATGLPLGEGP